MEYKWNLKNINSKLLFAKTIRNNRAIEVYSNLLAIGNNNISKEVIETDDIDEHERSLYFSYALDDIPGELYDVAINLYLAFNNKNDLNETIKFDKLNIDNDELIKIVYELICSTNNNSMIEYFEFLLKNKNINIMDNIPDITSTDKEKLGGLTMSNGLFRESYINIFRNYTVEDIEVLFHEFMHAYYYMLSNFDDKTYHLLPELEGVAGSIYSYDKIIDLGFKDASKLRKEILNSNIISSFLLIINHALFISDYNLDKAIEFLNIDTPELDLKLKEEDLKKYIGIEGFTTVSNILSYLIALDTYYKTDNEREYFKYITRIKINDHKPIDENLKDFDLITFYKDDLETIKKEYTKTRIK